MDKNKRISEYMGYEENWNGSLPHIEWVILRIRKEPKFHSFSINYHEDMICITLMINEKFIFDSYKNLLDGLYDTIIKYLDGE